MKKFSKMFALIAVIVLSLSIGCKGSEKGKGPLPSLNELTLKLWAEPAAINSGERTAVQWQTNLVGTTCKAVKGPWEGGYGGNGSFTTPPLTEDTVFGLKCECGDLKFAASEVTVKVNKAQPTETVFSTVPTRADNQSCEAQQGLRFTVVRTKGNASFPMPVSQDSWIGNIRRITPNCPNNNDCDTVDYAYDILERNPGSHREGRIKVDDKCFFTVPQPACPIAACELEVETSKEYSCDAQTVTYSFKTNKPWTLSGVTGLITDISPTSGDGTAAVETITFKIPSNKASDAALRRAGTFDIMGCNGGRMVFIMQRGCPTTPTTCQDQNATNFGGALPCIYPQPTCQERDADNYGQVGACRWTAEEFCNKTATVPGTCPNGSTVTGNGDETRSSRKESTSSKAHAIALAKAAACELAQSAADAEATTDRNNKVANCPAACPATTVPSSVAPVACTGTNNGSILFTGCPGKQWVASSPQLISIGTTSGTFDADGKGRLPFTMGNNTTGGTRNGSVIIDGKAITIPQEGCATVCSLNLPPATSLISSAGKSNGSVGFTGTPGCQWKMSTTTPGFVYFEGAQSGTIGANTSNPGYPPSGKGSALFSVTGNGGAARDLDLTFIEVSTGTVYRVKVPQSAWPN